MKYDHFKWYKIPKRGLFRDASGVAILIRRDDSWFMSNAEVITGHCHVISPTHFMIFPGVCLNWMGPIKIEKFISDNRIPL